MNVDFGLVISVQRELKFSRPKFLTYICSVCIEVGKYINKTIEKINFPKLEGSNQILSQDQIKAKLQDDHHKRMVELRRLKGMFKGVIESFVSIPTSVAARLWESMVYLHYILQQSLYWNLCFEV